MRSAVVKGLPSRSKLAIIAAVVGGAVAVVTEIMVPTWFPAVASNDLAIVCAYLLLPVLLILLPARAAYKLGPSGNVPVINGLFDCLHWAFCLFLVALVVRRSPSDFMNMDYLGFGQSLFLLAVTVAVFPLHLGRLRTAVCWALGVLCFVVLIIGREPSVVVCALATFLVAGTCTYLSLRGKMKFST
jgi:hypothetical protein